MCVTDVSMAGKVVIVTGGNTGIGFEVAKALSAKGARVILACRCEEKGNLARDRIISETSNHKVIFKLLNLASLKSVREFCEDVKKTEDRLDVLINNAGVTSNSDNYTEDGIIEALQVNHFGPFLLTLLLLPLLKKQPSRIINTSSIMHLLANINLGTINEKYNTDINCYMTSKLCNVLFTVDLARRLKGTGVVVNAVHPGIVDTGIVRNVNALYGICFRFLCWFCYRSAVEGAQTTIHLSVTDEGAEVTGKYFVDCAQSTMSWRVKGALGRQLFDLSVKMVKYDDNVDCKK
ncbi:retinol dehydrogenase 11-like [Galleria mellonella]|uniref:Retinol dehydrogenase 11-like n=1 Tax=Galleria mellonella TaxID=7137 RepID=A0ABM3N0B2_GALME|nr:retinol dehydrogenase 11-like [Galleria mellonella]